MRLSDLRLDELLELTPEGGILRFAGQRVLLWDAVALGLLRRQLIADLGPDAARSILTRLGFSHGWRTAEALRDQLPWEDEAEWRAAGGRLHQLQGMVRFEPVTERPEGACLPFARAIWKDSYEAEQHLLHLGQADGPACWTLTGFASGYLSFAHGRSIVCCEVRCRARGDAGCRMEGRPRDEWGPEMVPALSYYDQGGLETSLRRVQEALGEAERALSLRRRRLRAEAADVDDGLVARSDAMKSVLALATRAAAVDVTVLLTGETGVGKERVARYLHDRSGRCGGPFLAVNCGALPESLLESELFGHVRGAFTGATQDRIGLFEAARGGTLLLDEIGEVTPAVQVRLLRVLEAREVRRVGEERARPVDVRITAATHRDLPAMVAEGTFREDLYYRLRVVEIDVPPLRARPDDILPLARLFLADAAQRAGRPGLRLSAAASRALLGRRFPGNVRELAHAMERAAVLAAGAEVTPGDLPEELEARHLASERLADVERDHILRVLEATGGHRAEAARRLAIGPATLFRKLKRYREEGIEV
ncbi:MAG: sigma 54-interacting transcriptional regulator [Sandaracinaceae bacterium]